MKKPLKFAALSGIILIGILFFSMFVGIFSTLLHGTNLFYPIAIFELILDVTGTIFGIFFLFGFLVLAKRFNIRLLKVVSWIFIILAIMGTFFVLFIGIFDMSMGFEGFIESRFDEFLPETLENEGENEDLVKLQEELTNELINYILVIAAFIYILLVIYGILLILFGVGIIKLKENVELSKPTGILNIVTGACLIVPVIGWFFAIFTGIAMYILEVVLLFKASKKLEK